MNSNYILSRFRQLPVISHLIAVNVGIWLIVQVARLVCYLISGYDLEWRPWFALSSDLGEFLMQPWTLITYMFMHADFGTDVFHIIFNMLWLYWFGQFFVRYYSTRQLLDVYVLGGLVSGFFYILSLTAYNFLSSDPSAPLHVYSLVGASGAIFALVGAVAIRQPNEQIYLNFFVRVVPVKMKWFALGALFINLMGITGANTGGILCHLGGLAFGALWALYEKRPKTAKPKMKATRGGAHIFDADRQKDHDYNQRRHADQERINAILDKISRSGYDGLSADEKALLFDASLRKKGQKS